MKLANYHLNLDTPHVNTLAPRQYYVPYKSLEKALSFDRADSESLTLLNGQWDFQYCTSVKEIPEDIFTANLSAKIDVPSVWQSYGYDIAQYINTRYPFPCDPPFLPHDIPAAVYKRTINIDELSERKYIVFEGVDAGFYLYINGEFAGYSQVSHSTSEFDITDLLSVGENTITVVNVKWATGTYLEAQDKFRLSGIFRDVYMLSRPEGHLQNITVSGNANGEIQTDCTSPYTLYDSKGNVIDPAAKKELWTAETPNLYTIVFEQAGEYVPFKIGFQSVEIKGCQLYINGVSVKLKGTNHHDMHPDVGYALTLEQMRQDITIMKQHNLNAVRTSHYPPSPLFVELCAEMGMYVMLEADVETHGMGEAEPTFNLDSLMRDPRWCPQLLDRAERAVTRDQNSPAVVMWSLGNESGWGDNTIKMYDKVYEVDKFANRPVHYEGAAERPGTDVFTRMYSGVRFCEERCNEIETNYGKSAFKPFILCEYSHAMGEGPGDTMDYWNIIWKHSSFIGAFVWEWAEHSMPLDIIDGKRSGKRYGFGGDYAEPLHDGGFCMDGLVTPDRIPGPGMPELKAACAPIVLERVEGNRFRIINRYDFLTTAHLTGTYTIESLDGESLDGRKSSAAFAVPNVAPHESAEFTIDRASADIITLSVSEKNEEIAFNQFFDADELAKTMAIEPQATGKLSVTEDDDAIAISGENFAYAICKGRGGIASIVRKGAELLRNNEQIGFNIYRAVNDNDGNVSHNWRRNGFDTAYPYVYSTDTVTTATDDKVVVIAHIGMMSMWRPKIMDIDVTYTFTADSAVKIDTTVHKAPHLSWLPRFGLTFPLVEDNAEMTSLSYAAHSYNDMHHGQKFGWHTEKAADTFFNHIRPQETGNHYKTVKATVGGITFTSETPFEFSALPYSWQVLDKTVHNWELPDAKGTFVQVDYKQSGMGSGSCGDELLDWHRLNEEDWSWSVTMSL